MPNATDDTRSYFNPRFKTVNHSCDGSAYSASDSAVTDLKFLSVSGTVRLVSGNVSGGLKNIGVTIPGGLGLRLLNWREVPTVD
ncbi:MAG TPA: hypothetical protein VGI11_02525 [Variovorax sp.]